jgi:hypothetical protein
MTMTMTMDSSLTAVHRRCPSTGRTGETVTIDLFFADFRLITCICLSPLLLSCVAYRLRTNRNNCTVPFVNERSRRITSKTNERTSININHIDLVEKIARCTQQRSACVCSFPSCDTIVFHSASIGQLRQVTDERRSRHLPNRFMCHLLTCERTYVAY